MVAGVPDNMCQRIFDRFDQRLVQFRLLAFHLQANLFTNGHGKIPNNTRKLAPDIANGLHPGFHDTFLQFRSNQVQMLAGCNKRRVALGGSILQYLVSSQNQFPNKIHQPIEDIHIHTNAGIRHTPGFFTPVCSSAFVSILGYMFCLFRRRSLPAILFILCGNEFFGLFFFLFRRLGSRCGSCHFGTTCIGQQFTQGIHQF